MSRTRKPARRETVVLDRTAVETILVQIMGWEDEDVTAFWRNARRETRDPGCFERKLREDHARLMERLEADLAAQY